MSSGFPIFSPNYLLHQLSSPNNTLVESYQQNEEFVEKPRKRIRQRVDAGLPRNAYSKNSNTANPIFSNPFRIESDTKMNLNLIEQLQNRSQSSFGNLASSYFASPYLHTFLRLQQLKQSNLHNLINGEIKIQELADDETENEYESNRKRAKTNSVECVLSKIHNDERSSPAHNKEMSPGVSDQKDPSDDQDDRNETNSVGNLTDASSQSEPVRMDRDPKPSTSVVPKPSPMVQVGEPEVPTELKDLADKLKSELMQTLSDTVDKIVNQFLEDETLVSRPPTVSQVSPPEGTVAMIQGYPQLIQAPAYQSIFPNYSRPHQSSLCSLNVLANKNKNDQNGPLSMIFGRKRRTKVTDTRVNRLSLKSDNDGIRSTNGPNGFHFPTMVPQTPKWGHEGSEYSSNSPENFEAEGMDFDNPNYQSSTLTPMHLRKAKLIFFYARYPTSALLKAYFPDIRFHKNNTAQLVKWFSNFREYYYIQMEKYARQALAEGVKKAEDIHISADCELYRSLIQHYSRNNNYIQVPLNFRPVVESTLREFFTALQNNRDLEPSWKKSIYKVIARMDEHIPEYFKTTNFLEQLK